MQILPAAMVPAARAMLKGQGIDPYIITNTGEIDPVNLFGAGFEEVELRTRLTPAVSFNLTGPSNPEMAALLRQIQPMITLRGRLGTKVIAPYGVPTGVVDFSVAGASAGLGVGAALLGLLLIGSVVFR